MRCPKIAYISKKALFALKRAFLYADFYLFVLLQILVDALSSGLARSHGEYYGRGPCDCVTAGIDALAACFRSVVSADTAASVSLKILGSIKDQSIQSCTYGHDDFIDFEDVVGTLDCYRLSAA